MKGDLSVCRLLWKMKDDLLDCRLFDKVRGGLHNVQATLKCKG
jgi:hypothetical protein